MVSLISRASNVIYRHGVKPILFRFKPDAVHNALLKQGSLLQKSSLIRHALRVSWAYQNTPKLRQTVFGIQFNNPVGLSAGFDKNFELVPIIKSIGFGFMEGGSLTLHDCAGNPRPWFYRLPKTKSLVVNAGLANHGVKAIIERLKNYTAANFKDFPLNISIAKTNSQKTSTDTEAIADYVGSLTLLQKAKLGDMYTLNISCPNTYGGEPFTTPARLDALLKATDKLNLKQPLIIKMPVHMPWSELDGLLNVATKHSVQGVTVSNLAKDRSKANLKDPLPDAVKGNLSGAPSRELSNELIKQTYRKYGERFVIIGVGGVFSAEDAYAKIKLGATLVELITGMIFEGPQLVGQINKGLVRLLERDGYKNIREAIGVDSIH